MSRRFRLHSRFRLAVFAFLLSLKLGVGVWSVLPDRTLASAPPVSSPADPWNGDVDQVYRYATTEPVTGARLESILRSLGLESTQLRQLVRVCAESGSDFQNHLHPSLNRDLRQALRGVARKSIRSAVAFADPRFSPEILRSQSLPHEILSYLRIEKHFAVGLLEKPEFVCLRKNLNISEAAETLVHELIHLSKPSSEHFDSFLSRYPDANTYAEKHLLIPGGELDAFVAGFGFVIRKEGKSALPEKARELFTGDGKLISRTKEKFVRLLLQEAGYADVLKRQYKQRLVEMKARTDIFGTAFGKKVFALERISYSSGLSSEEIEFLEVLKQETRRFQALSDRYDESL